MFTFDDTSSEEPGIVGTENEFPCVLIDRVIDGNIIWTEIGQGEQRGNVRIVHQILIAQSIDLIGIDQSVLRVFVRNQCCFVLLDALVEENLA